MSDFKAETLKKAATILAQARENDKTLFREISDLINLRVEQVKILRPHDKIVVEMTAGQLQQIQAFLFAYASAEDELAKIQPGG